MRINKALKVRKHRRSIRLVLTTRDIGELLGIGDRQVRNLIANGVLKFTGDSVEDFRNLAEVLHSRIKE